MQPILKFRAPSFPLLRPRTAALRRSAGLHDPHFTSRRIQLGVKAPFRSARALTISYHGRTTEHGATIGRSTNIDEKSKYFESENVRRRRGDAERGAFPSVGAGFKKSCGAIDFARQRKNICIGTRIEWLLLRVGDGSADGHALQIPARFWRVSRPGFAAMRKSSDVIRRWMLIVRVAHSG